MRGLVILLITLGSAMGSAASTVDGTCTDAERLFGCPDVTGTINTTDVTLTGTETPRGTVPRTPPTGPVTPTLDECSNPDSTICPRGFIATVTAPVTLADIAAFRPTAPVDHMEPNGWTVVGLDTNFYATGSAHVVSGTLLGQPAEVRFTPVEWHWSYGDGSAASHPSAGATWAALGVGEFDATGTSHVYTRNGTFVIDLDVDYAAEYRFAGGPWVGIAGVLTVPANRLVIVAGDAKTVLVEKECGRNPTGPGC